MLDVIEIVMYKSLGGLMGAHHELTCPCCGYMAEVSGPLDGGVAARTATISCASCRELRAVVIGEEPSEAASWPLRQAGRRQAWGARMQLETTRSPMRALAVVALALLACNSGALSAPDDGGAADASATGDLTLSTELDLLGSPDLPPLDLAGADLALPYVCYGPESSFPKFPDGCAVDNDCVFVALHQIDCCGRRASFGIQAASAAAFQAAEEDFEKVHCPALCDCVQGPTFCQDGKTVMPGNEGAIRAVCLHGTCQTRCP